MCDGFVYEEGDDLDEEELEANAANLPKTLHSLPGVHCHSSKPVSFLLSWTPALLVPFFLDINLLSCAIWPCADTGYDFADVTAARTSST